MSCPMKQIFIFIFILLTLTTVASAALTDGLQYAIPFTDGTANDTASGDHDWALFNDPIDPQGISGPGMPTQSMRQDTDIVRLVDMDSFTLCMALKSTGVPPPGPVSLYQEADSFGVIFTEQPDESLFFGTNGGDGGFIQTPASVITTDWQDVCFQEDDATDRIAIYINGVLIVNGTSELPATSDGGEIRVDNQNAATNYVFIDEFNAWNRSLSPSEMVERFDSFSEEVPVVDATAETTTSLTTVLSVMILVLVALSIISETAIRRKDTDMKKWIKTSVTLFMVCVVFIVIGYFL